MAQRERTSISAAAENRSAPPLWRTTGGNQINRIIVERKSDAPGGPCARGDGCDDAARSGVASPWSEPIDHGSSFAQGNGLGDCGGGAGVVSHRHAENGWDSSVGVPSRCGEPQHLHADLQQHRQSDVFVAATDGQPPARHSRGRPDTLIAPPSSKPRTTRVNGLDAMCPKLTPFARPSQGQTSARDRGVALHASPPHTLSTIS